ncbi:hypothetical protein A2U01_0063164, partial [Trifolium medium]|nr:hypothetical protein [Trifolium medium]
PDNEPPENVQDNVVPNTPEVDATTEKEKTSENVMPADASDTNTAVNSPSNGCMETEVMEVNDTTSEEKSIEETPAPSISKRLRSNTGKGVATASQQANTPSKGKKAATPKHVKYGP